MSRMRNLIERASALGRGQRAHLSGDPAQAECDPVVVLAPSARAFVARTPSRRVVGELASALVATPIALGVAAMIAAPWPKPVNRVVIASQAPAPASVASLTQTEIADALARAAQGAKLVARAAPVAIRPAVAEAAPPIQLAPSSPHPSEPQLSERPLPDRRLLHAAAARTSVSADGRLVVDGEQVKLAGVEMPKAGAMCRRLDGAHVPCIERVVARLTIITQMRAVECRTRIDDSGERTGQCQAGKIDLTRDLIHARLARPVETASAVLTKSGV